MGWHEDATPRGAAPPARGSPTRRRLLALLGGLPAMGREAVGAESPFPRATGSAPVTEPIPRVFAELRALLDQHEAALACCDRLEATLLEQMGYPRVPLPPDWDGSQRYAGDAGTIARLVASGLNRRRLQRLLQRRQRRWNEAAHSIGLTAAQVVEAELDGAVLDKAEGLLATPAWTLDAVVLKLVVLLGTQEPGPSASATSPWRELRLILVDLRGLADRGGITP